MKVRVVVGRGEQQSLLVTPGLSYVQGEKEKGKFEDTRRDCEQYKTKRMYIYILIITGDRSK